MKNRIFFALIISVLISFQVYAQSKQSAHQLTQSCYITTDGKVIINAGGHYTSLASEQVFMRDSLYSSVYDTVTSAFKNNKRQSYTYDAGGLVTQSLAKTLDKSGTTWSNSQEASFKYTGFQLYEETFRNWDKTIPDWVNFFNHKYSYETDNSLLSIFYQPWDATNQEWDYSTKDLFSYDANMKVISVANQKWNKNLASWENNLRVNFTYSAGNISLKIYQLWNKTNQQWEDYQKETLTYSGSSISEMVTQTKTAVTEWENYSRTQYVYENSALSSTTEYLWYGSWSENKKFLYSYNVNNLLSSTTTQIWVAHLGNFRNLAFDESFYSKREVIGIDELPADQIMVISPVSKNSTLTIKGLQENTKYMVSLISLNGSTLMAKSVKAGESVSLINKLTNGIYFLSIKSSDGKSSIQKILVTD